MRWLIWGLAGRTYHIVGNLMSWLIYYAKNIKMPTIDVILTLMGMINVILSWFEHEKAILPQKQEMDSCMGLFDSQFVF